MWRERSKITLASCGSIRRTPERSPAEASLTTAGAIIATPSETTTGRCRLDANNAEAYTLRGDAQADQAQFAQAVSDYQAAVRVNPEYGRAYQSSAWLRATCPMPQFRHTEVALRNAQKAIDIDGEGDHRYLETLAAAQAHAGQFDDAKVTQTRAIEAARQAKVTQQVSGRMQERLQLYQASQPYRDVRPGQPQPRQ